MTDPRPSLLAPLDGLTATLVEDHPCPRSAAAQGFVRASAARLSADDWDDAIFGGVAGVRCARHRGDPRVVLVELEDGAFASRPPAPPADLVGFVAAANEVVLDGARGDAVLVEVGGDIYEIANLKGRVVTWHASAAGGPAFDAPAPELPTPPDPVALYSELGIAAAIADRARALSADPAGSLEAHGLVLRTWSHADPTAAVEALLAGRDVPAPHHRLDAWLGTLDDAGFGAWVHRAHARLDAWAEAVLALDDHDGDIAPEIGAALLSERDALQSLRFVLSRRGERALGRRLDALDPLLRDGPPIAWEPAPEDRAWVERVRAADPDAWWTSPLFLTAPEA